MVVMAAAAWLAVADRGRPTGGVGTAAHSGITALSVGGGHEDRVVCDDGVGWVGCEIWTRRDTGRNTGERMTEAHGPIPEELM